MSRVLLVLVMLAATAGAVVAYGDPEQIARASDTVSEMLRQRSLQPAPAVQIARGQAGEFALHAKINGVKAPMVIDTGATSVVLTWETAKAIGLPLEMLEYNVDVETAGGHTKAARLTLDRLAVGQLVEKSVPALVVPRGQMKTNLLGMSFLDRLESWGVQADKLMLHGYPDVAGRINAPCGELERDGLESNSSPARSTDELVFAGSDTKSRKQPHAKQNASRLAALTPLASGHGKGLHAAIDAAARSSTSAIASRSTLTPAPGLTPFSARWRRNARAPGTP